MLGEAEGSRDTCIADSLLLKSTAEAAKSRVSLTLRFISEKYGGLGNVQPENSALRMTKRIKPASTTIPNILFLLRETIFLLFRDIGFSLIYSNKQHYGELKCPGLVIRQF